MIKIIFAICTAILFVQMGSAGEKAELISNHSLELLKQLVEINSATDNIDGLNKIRERLIPEFESIGFTATVFEVGNQRKVLSFEKPGADPQLILLGHIDTVFPKTSSFQKFERNDNHLKGPGVIGMKGGIVMILEILKSIKDEQVLKKIRVVLNDDEEVGSPSSAGKLKELAKNISYALVFEPGLPDGSVITSHSGVYWLELMAEGKASHAGTDFLKGLNACLSLAAKLTKIAKLSAPKRNFTVNIGTLEGGTKPNVVCEKAVAKVDIRYVDPKDLNMALKRINSIVAEKDAFNPALKSAPRSSVKELIHVPSMTQNSTRELFQIAQKEASKLGLKLLGKHAAFASDANQLATTGIKLLVALGASGENSHTDQEIMNLLSFPERLSLNRALISHVLSLR